VDGIRAREGKILILAKFNSSLKAKLPARQEALVVFSVIVFIVFSWTLYRVFWWVPSWLEYLSIWNILIIVAYVLAFALFESLAVMGLIVILGLLFPKQTFKDQFIVQGSAISAALGVIAFLVQRKVSLIYKLELWQTLAYPTLILIGVVILVPMLSYIFKRFNLLSRLALAAAERMTIFVYLYVPLGLIGVLVVVARNLW
jgi:hypothetical protein